MIKKFFLSILLVFTLLASVNAVEISSCPSTINDGDEFEIAEDFFVGSTPCFDLTGKNNITIRSANSNAYIPVSFQVLLYNSTDITLNHLDADSVTFYDGRLSSDIVVRDNYLRKQQELFSHPATTGEIKNILVEDNIFIADTKDTSLFWYVRRTSGETPIYFDYNYTEFYRNDVIGFEYVFSGDATYFTAGYRYVGKDYIRFTNYFHARDNNIATYEAEVSSWVTTSTSCGSYTWADNYFGFLDGQTYNDGDGDFETDADYVKNTGSCPLAFGKYPTRAIAQNTDKFEENIEYGFSSWYNPNWWKSNTRYIVTSPQSYNATNYVSMTGVSNSILDLTYNYNVNNMVLTNVRQLRMGNNNVIQGNPTTKTNIVTSGTISVVYGGEGTEYSNNWHLIEYGNGLTIDSINFDLNAVDNYGLLRKSSTSVDGINFIFTNNEVDMNFVPADTNRPVMMFGAFSKIENNVFHLPTSTNIDFFGGGISSGVGGGHMIVNNDFYGGGTIFNKLTDAIGGVNYPSSFIHNAFRQEGTEYAQPFDPNFETQNLLANPNLNGSYYYKTACTNYEFNVGNWYEDWDDSGFYNDSNTDGIHDSYLGLDYIERGQDYLGNPIRDYRSVTPYPYDFAGNVGNAISTTDTCIVFNFNVVEPTAQNYSSGHTLVTNWEYSTTGQSDLICFEDVNGFTTIYENVDSGDNKGQSYDTTDGQGVFNLKCCDTPLCDNFVEEIEPIEFCIGDCGLGQLVVQGTEEPPVDVYGCTDNTATNYNPSATIDDGSCTYDNGGDTGGDDTGGETTSGGVENLFSSNIDDSGDSVSGLFGLASTPLNYGMIIGFAFIFIGVIAVIFAIIMVVIG